MDALQLLGSLLGNNATSSGVGDQILGQLVNSLSGAGRPAGGGTAGGTVNTAYFGGAASGGGADIAGLLGNLAMTALQMFSQRGAASGQSPLAALASGLGFGQSAGFDPAQVQQQANHQATTLVRAMINAAKADGQIDAEEQQKIVARLGNVGPQEAAFIREEMARPLNFDFFADITADMAPQVYAVSLMAINLDSPAESNYMQQLAQGLGLDPQAVNGIHAQLGLVPLYA
jgi:uncharacterized membrane protein YebE (DUF533 family)